MPRESAVGVVGLGNMGGVLAARLARGGRVVAFDRDPERCTAAASERVREGRYDGGMPTEAARKDSALTLEMARSGGVPLFCMQAADSVYELALRAGLGRNDYASIATLWEDS
jgi:3-hydroxyisobutyrate dehydrogenase-like beta-hydroxyacid dehydrogenase